MKKKVYLLFLMLLIPAVSFSQVNLVSVGIYGGVMVPVGNFAHGYKTSPHIGIEGFRCVSKNIDVVVDIAYTILSTKFELYTNTNFYFLETTAGVRYNFTPTKEKFFIEAGIGAYTFGSKYTFGGVDYKSSTTDLGINAGVGGSLPIDKSFAISGKLKLHNRFPSGESTNYITIAAGINYLFK